MALRHIYTALIIFLIHSATLTASAQRNYPIRATAQYTPPYSLFLGDYATPKLIVTLTGQDLLDANCPIKLSISLECQNVKITTKPSYSPAPLYISGGQTIVLTGAELARYFDIQNLDFHGITAAKYLQDGQLPEGFYRMNIKVLNYNDNRQISNTAFVMFNARMGKPPILTLPKNKSLIPPNQQVMPITFSWTPKTVGAYQYRFEIWECAVPDIPVQTVVSTVRPIHTQTTFSPMLTIHPANLNMKPGTEYAWRITVEDPQNQQKFANQGRSEIFTFTYKRKPEGVTGLNFTHRGLRVTWSWEMSPAHSSYHFQYYDPQTGRTIDIPCEYNTFSINLPQTGYHIKARVQAECYNDPTLLSDFTPYLDTYVEPIPVPEYECGKVFPDREITNLELKHSFAPGEIVESKNGDTRYEIIYANENNGYLSGQFFMIMDCWGGAKIRCEFSQTQINTDNIVLKTIFHNVPDSTLYLKPETIRKEVEQAFFDAATVLTDFSIKDTVKIDKPYTYLYINESGKMVAVIDDKGKIKTEETTISATNLKENTLIQGKNGEELVLTKKGQVMGKNEFNATGGNSVLLKEYHRKSDSLAQWQINFLPDTKHQTYAFDYLGSGNHGIFSSSDYYPQSGSYDFRYKSVECGKNDKVIVEFGSYPQADSVVFKDKYGVTYPISSKDNVLSFTGVSKADINFIYAYRGDQKIGKLFLNTYQPQTKYIELVRVNGAKIDKSITAEGLNQIFKGAVVNFKIEIKSLDIRDLKTFTHGGSNWHSVYNDDQKKVLEAYDSLMKDDKFYLFFVDNVLDKKDSLGTSVSGYMPRGYNAGFIYEGGSLHTVAHELGHGIGNLEHVFENSSNSGKTKNLMDYSFEKDAEQLWHFQWDQIQDPSRVWMKWNKDEGEGENKGPIDNYFVAQLWENCKFAKRLSKTEFEKKISEPSFFNCSFSYGNLQNDEFSTNSHKYSKEKISSILQAKENSLKNAEKTKDSDINDWKRNLDNLYECTEEQLKFYYEYGKPISWSDILLTSPFFIVDLFDHTFRTMCHNLAVSDPYEKMITDRFYGDGAPVPLIFSEKDELSKKLHRNYNFQKDYYLKVVEYIYDHLKKPETIGKESEEKLKEKVGIPNFNYITDIPFYDYYGIFGGIQKVSFNLKLYRNDKKYPNSMFVDIVLYMGDWYGSDEDDFVGVSNMNPRKKHNQICMNAFFLLQHKFGCHPFETLLIFHDYLEFKLD